MSTLAPFFDVQIFWAGRHFWPANQTRERAATGTNLWLLLEGEIAVTSGEKTFSLAANQAFLVARDTPRRIETRRATTWLSLTLGTTLFGRLDAQSAWKLPHLWTPQPDDRLMLQTAMERLAQGWNSREPETQMLCNALARVVWSLCWGAIGAPDPLKTSAPDWVTRALDQLRQTPAISTAQWAKATGYSSAQFRRLFTAWFGMAPHDYQARHRLETARGRLQHSTATIAQIGEEVGFSNLSHFTRTFRLAYGMPPATFRRAAQRGLGDEL